MEVFLLFWELFAAFRANKMPGAGKSRDTTGGICYDKTQIRNGGTNMRIMAIDYGDARTGIAISDPTASIVGITTVIHSWNQEKTAQEICRLVREHGVDEVVMGFPKNMNGTEGPRAQLYREFAQLLEQLLGKSVRLWDERRTTVEAHQILSANNYHGRKRKNTVDAVAASLILEGYLSYRSG